VTARPELDQSSDSEIDQIDTSIKAEDLDGAPIDLGGPRQRAAVRRRRR
jgi:hypothetical protein